MFGHAEVCALLLDARADVEAVDLQKKTALSWAADREHVETCKVLLDYGADIEATDCVLRDGTCALL